MERHDWASGSRDCGRAQITGICAHTGGILTRQSAAPNGGYRSNAVSVRGRGARRPYVRYTPHLVRQAAAKDRPGRHGAPARQPGFSCCRDADALR